MIARLRGILLEISDEDVLVEVAGIGYVVRCGVRSISNMPELGQEVIVHIESQTREDGTKLFGFLSKDDRKAFVSLLGVQGVGPKAALSVLDILSPHELAHAVATDDKSRVCKATGVGPKLAQRIVLELKGKALSLTEAFEPMGVSSRGIAVTMPTITGESVSALIGLGINETQARLAVEAAMKHLEPDAHLPVVIRAALKSLGK